MENILCSPLYKEFRTALLQSNAGHEQMAQIISKAIVPTAEIIHIGKISEKHMAPSTAMQRKSINESVTIYQSPTGFADNALIETFRTEDNGLSTIEFHPTKGHKFSEDEIQAVKLLSMDIFTIVGRSRLVSKIHQASLTDTMTGIPNMASLVQHGIELKVSHKLETFAGIFINLKNYKYINKAYSSAIADQGLVYYANALQNFVKDGEYAARLGGDNFFLLIQQNNLSKFIETFATLHITIPQGKTEFNIQSRMGIYLIRENDSISEVMHYSSIALAESKNATSNNITFFNSKILQKVLHEKEISSIFQEAFQNNEFIVYYQPKVHLEGNRLYGCEALVRWKRNNAIIAPADFLPILEKETSICQLDFFVFETVCKHIRSWLDRGIEPVRVSTNFSKLHLRNQDLAENIFSIMKKYNIDSRYIEIELTEVSDFDDNIAMQKFITTLRKEGVAISIDDFGTGYSTLNVLKDFDVDVIKLDKSLLDHIAEQKIKDKVVLKNMVSMMNELNKEVIAEGVESKTQIDFLKDIKCSMVQGFIYDKPMPLEEFEERLKNKRTY